MGFDKTASKPKNKPASISPSIKEEIQELSDDIFTQTVNLKSGKYPKNKCLNYLTIIWMIFDSYNIRTTFYTTIYSTRKC